MILYFYFCFFSGLYQYLLHQTTTSKYIITQKTSLGKCNKFNFKEEEEDSATEKANVHLIHAYNTSTDVISTTKSTVQSQTQASVLSDKLKAEAEKVKLKLEKAAAAANEMAEATSDKIAGESSRI